MGRLGVLPPLPRAGSAAACVTAAEAETIYGSVIVAGRTVAAAAPAAIAVPARVFVAAESGGSLLLLLLLLWVSAAVVAPCCCIPQVWPAPPDVGHFNLLFDSLGPLVLLSLLECLGVGSGVLTVGGGAAAAVAAACFLFQTRGRPQRDKPRQLSLWVVTYTWWPPS